MWTVGQLASATGVTVRALHHYDAQGLLVPSARTEAGYRLYAEADVERLYRIRPLQALGLSLTEVAEVLDGLPLADVLRRQHAATVEELVETMKEVEMHERYFTTEQREAIASRSHLAADGERAWAEL